MEWLETGLAFAVTIMVFSTVVSVNIETGHPILRIREKGLKRLMETLYEEIIWPRLSNRLHKQGHRAESALEICSSVRFGTYATVSKIRCARDFTPCRLCVRKIDI